MARQDDELNARSNARLGTVLREKYRLDRVLGSGGMATVYLAVHRNGHRVAVKMLHRELSFEKDIRARFLREGYVANSIEHPGVVRVIDDDTTDDGSAYLVMELLDGETLDARWERKGRHLDAREVSVLISQVLDVLVVAHASGVVHRDIKPENLFVTRKGEVKILDFGIARVREMSGTATRSGSVFGTPAFMAREQALGRVKEIDAQSDLWAVGATAFTLLAGRYVHPAQTGEEMMVLSATRPATPIDVVVTDVPKEIAGVFDRALAFNKADRWPSARAMQQALAAAHLRVYGKAIASTTAADEEEVDELRTLLFVPEAERSAQRTIEMGTVQRAPTPKPSTMAAVASSRGDESRATRKAPLALMAIGATVVALVLVSGIAAIVMHRVGRPGAPSSASAPATTSMQTASAISAEPAAPSATPSATPAPSTVAIDELPKATPTAPAARVAPTTSAVTVTPPPAVAVTTKPTASSPPKKRDPLAP